jgi:[lysine-biosynthesis-protein LysW]---L-2-aminoadipate ligase
MRVALVYPDLPWYETGYDEAWADALERRGADVQRVDTRSGPPPANGRRQGQCDIVIPHVLVEDVVARSASFAAAVALEAAGAPLLNSISSIVASSDKLTTHAIWARHGIPQPCSRQLDAVERWPVGRGRPLVLKPAYGDGARHVTLVSSLREARSVERAWRRDERRGGERRGRALLQAWIEDPACVRIFATPHETSFAYEKSRRTGELVTHGTVYPREYEPGPALAALARRMVAALGGGLMGVDVLVDAAGRQWALEANAPFGFDVTDPAQGAFVAAAAARTARRWAERSAASR